MLYSTKNEPVEIPLDSFGSHMTRGICKEIEMRITLVVANEQVIC